jgi:hypothetical protein
MKKQNEKIFYYHDLLGKNLKKKEMEKLLEYNSQQVPAGQVQPFHFGNKIFLNEFVFNPIE